jgi:hypothetical protein
MPSHVLRYGKREPRFLHDPSLPRFKMVAPEYLFTPYGNVDPGIEQWCDENLREAWCFVYDFRRIGDYFEFESEVDLIHFKLRWVG